MTAEALGIKRTAYENYESGRREAPIAVLERAADLFGCELHQLFSEDKDNFSDVLVCTFRQEGLTASDMKIIADFKGLAKQYMKLKRLSQE